MSGLLKHWFNTSNTSGIKSISTKPLKITTRDAIIITVLSVVVALVMTWLYYIKADTSYDQRYYWPVLWQSVLISMSAQYVYEYSGVNNMIAESSMRYAKGSTMAKYVSRREALAYQCYYKLSLNQTVEKQNFDLLLAILTRPQICGDIMDGYSKSKLYIKYPKYHAQINLLMTVPDKNIPVLGYLSDHITKEIIYDILVNGITDYEIDGNIIPGLRNEEKFTQRGRSYIKKAV